MASKKQKPPWKLINLGGPLESYPCGLKMGDCLILRRTLTMTTNGKPTGEVFAAGSTWLVLAGFDAEPHVIWLRNPAGTKHTWDDTSIWESFDKVQDEVSSA